MELKKSRVFRNCNGIPNATQQLDGVLKSISPSPGPSNWSSQTSSPNILGQLEEELVVKDTIKTEIESPHRESDQEGYDMLNIDKEVTYSDVKMEGKVLLNIKAEPRSFSVCSNACDKLGQIKVETPEYVSNITQTLDGKLEFCVKTKPGCSAWSSNGGDMLRQSTEELVVKDAIKAEMKSLQRESDHEGNDTLYTDIDVTHSDVKKEAEDIMNITGVNSEGEHCSNVVNRNTSIRKHLEKKQITCLICKKCFGHKSHLNEHMLIHNAEKPFSCSICSKSFLHKSKLERHTSSVHSNEKPFSCSICSKSFSRKSYLKSHMMVHCVEKPFSCSICSKLFSRKSHFKNHILIHSKEKPFSCLICSKRFSLKSYLKLHMLVHSEEEKPFSCSICSKSFRQKSYLKAHMLVHSNKKTFLCLICSKRFGHKSTLKRHMPVHYEEKPFSCSICSKCFSQKAYLKDHMLVHSVEKRFSCSICSKLFNQKLYLNEHMLVHSAEKPFSCSICSKSFLHKSKLERHIPVHSEEKPFSC